MQEKHQLVALHTPPTGALAGNPGVCPNQELKQQPLCLQDDANQATPVRALPRFLMCISGGEVSGLFWGLCPWYDRCELFEACVLVWKVPEVFWCSRV